MLTFIPALCIMLLFIGNSSAVSAGATKGLMLWYKNILPLLLPFLLISNHIVGKSLEHHTINRRTNIFITILLGVFCGYPIGAKCTAAYVTERAYGVSMGNAILPLCNNLSPMFLSGYITCFILENRLSFFSVIFLIYAPYVVLCGFRLLFIREKNISCNAVPENPKKPQSESSQITVAINQITVIGVYIIICSIIIEFILRMSMAKQPQTLLCSIVEVTNGVNLIAANLPLEDIKNTALVLAVTSFGGLSSILQTKSVIADSKLSLFQYIVSKALCGVATYYLTILIL